MNSLSVLRDSKEELLSLGLRMRGKTYWDYVLPSLARHRCMSSLFHEYGIFMNRMNPLYGDPSEFVVTKITAQDLTENEIVEQAEREMKKETLGKLGIRAEFLTVRSGKRSRDGFLSYIHINIWKIFL